MRHLFPEIQTTRTNTEQAQKVINEVNEFLASKTDEEAIDILHAAETLMRVHFKGREKDLDNFIKIVMLKNMDRGYYKESCY